MIPEAPINEIYTLEALFKRFYKPLRAYAFRFVNDMNAAEDIVQEVFFELWARRDNIHFDEAVKSYLFKSVYNRSINMLNSQNQNSLYALDQTDESLIVAHYLSAHIQNQEQSLILKELEKEITLYIESLPPQCRKIFVLSRTYELKNREIAEQLNISIKAVEKQIGKALFGLKLHLKEKDLFVLLLLLQINI